MKLRNEKIHDPGLYYNKASGSLALVDSAGVVEDLSRNYSSKGRVNLTPLEGKYLYFLLDIKLITESRAVAHERGLQKLLSKCVTNLNIESASFEIH